MHNRVFAVVLAILMVMGVMTVSASGEAEQGTRVINVASTFPTGSPQDQGLVRFKESLEENSDGAFEVIIHAGGAMGNERETFEMLSAGEVEIGAGGTNDIATFYPEYAVSEVPYIFSSVDQFWAYWNGELGQEIHDIIEEERGVRTVGVVLRGARYLTANRPVRNVAEVEGLKMRLPQVESWFAVWESLGALPQPISFSEVYLALQTGTVEAQENPPETILNYNFFEVQDYLIKTEHIYSAARYQVSMAWLDSLSDADREMVLAAMDEGTEYANSLTENGDEEFVRILVEEHGMELIEVDQEAFSAAVQPVLEEFAETEWVPGLFEALQEL